MHDNLLNLISSSAYYWSKLHFSELCVPILCNDIIYRYLNSYYTLQRFGKDPSKKTLHQINYFVLMRDDEGEKYDRLRKRKWEN